MLQISISDRTLQKLFTKHGKDFGLTGPWDPSRAMDMRNAITSHLNRSSVQTIRGMYRGVAVNHAVDPTSGLNIILNATSDMILGGWKLSDEQLASVLGSGRLF